MMQRECLPYVSTERRLPAGRYAYKAAAGSELRIENEELRMRN